MCSSDLTYAVDRSELDSITGAGLIPVVHLGQMAGVASLVQQYCANWTVACLWCSRRTTEQRLVGRSDTRIAERLIVWDVTEEDLRRSDPSLFTLALNSDVVSAARAAIVIDAIQRGEAAMTEPDNRVTRG